MATSARKQVIGIGCWPKSINTKLEVLKWVQTQIPTYQWPIKEKGKNKGKLIAECFDLADSFIIAKYGVADAKRNL